MRRKRTAALIAAGVVLAAAGWLVYSAFASSLPIDRAGPLPEPKAARTKGPPNVILIVADDLGYGGISSYGGNRFATPHIDALARRGVRYTNAHVSAPVCSPSRAGMLTGRSSASFGFEFNPGDQQDEATQRWGLPVTVATLPEALRRGGYVTAAIGKWHLGAAAGLRPTERGFDEFFGVLQGAFNYFSIAPEGADASLLFRVINGPDRKVTPFLRGTKKVRVDGYVTDRFTHEARSFIRRNADKPFFLYLAYNAPHSPFEAPAEYLARFPQLKGVERTFAAMMAALDDGVGSIEADLRRLGIADNTLIVFVSDNGCPHYPELDGRMVCSNAPFAGTKGSLFEGALRVPLIVAGAGFAPAVSDAPVSALDIAPTVLAIAGAPSLAGIQGMDLRGSRVGSREQFWRYGQTIAVNDGAYKLLIAERADPGAEDTAGDNPLARIRRKLTGEEARAQQASLMVYNPGVTPRWGRHVMLYDLVADPGERRNLAAVDPQRVAAMTAAIAAYNRTLPGRPMWGADMDAIAAHDGVKLVKH